MLKVEIPLTAVAVRVPSNVPVPEVIAAVITADELVTVFPPASKTVTIGWVVNAAADAVPADRRDTVICVAAPTEPVTTCVGVPRLGVV